MTNASLQEGPTTMNASQDIDLSAFPVADGVDVVSMMRAVSRVRDVLGISREQATAAVAHRLLGGVLPDMSMAQLEALAAAGGARVSVLIETEDGRTLNLAQML
jgi:hypothetical protein